MMKKNVAVRLEDVTVEYGDAVVLDGVNLSVFENDFLGIIGPNGGGKTTILKVILGLVKPKKGKVLVFGGTPVENRGMIGYVPQHSHFDREFPATVCNTVMMGRMRGGMFRRFDDEDARVSAQALKTVDALELKNRQIGSLSGGELQRVMIARALACEPRILLLDEPVASVDRRVESRFYELLVKLNKKMTVVLVSHDIGAVSVYVDKIACVNQKLYYHGDKEIAPGALAKTYKCPVELIAHGVPHRVLKMHKRASK